MDGDLLLLPSGAFLLLPDGTRLLLPAPSDDTTGVVVIVAGDVMPATHDWWIRLPVGETATAGARIEGRRAEFTRLPRDGDEIEIRAGGVAGTVLFGGYLDEPNPQIIAPGIVAFDLGAVGWRSRLDGMLLSQEAGIRIVKLATGTDQIEALAVLLAGEGFTSQVDLAADDVPVRDDMRLRFSGPLVDHVSQVNDALVAVRPDKAVIARSRSQVTGAVVLDWDIIESIKVERSRESFKTSLTVRGGALTRLESHVGRTDGKYRLGGAQNLTPAVSLFLVAALGEGVEWIDERARPLSGPGESLLLANADMVEWPVSVVPTGDREVHELTLGLEGLILRGPTVPVASTAGLAVRASDGSEWGWPLAGFTPRAGVLFAVNAPSGSSADKGLWIIHVNAAVDGVDSTEHVGSFALRIHRESIRCIASHDGELYIIRTRSGSDELIRVNPTAPHDESGDYYGAIGRMPVAQSGNIGSMTSHGGRLLGASYASSPGVVSLWHINVTVPGDSVLLGAFPSMTDRIDGLASHEGGLYGAGGRRVSSNVFRRVLWHINADDPDDETGDYGYVGDLPGTLRITGLASVGGKLIAADGASNNNSIHSINTTNPSDTSDPYGYIGPVGTIGLSGLTYHGGGSAIPLSSLGISDVAELEAIVAKLRDGDSKLVLVDTSQPRVDLPNRLLRAVGEIVEIEVLSLESVNVDGVAQSIGGSGDGWCWNVSTQEAEELAPSDPPPTAVNVQYKARYVVDESSGISPAVDAVIVEEGIALPADARIHARNLLELDSRPIEEAVAALRPGLGQEIAEGTGATIPQDVLDFFGVAGTAADVWRIEEIEIRPVGLRYQFTLRLLRRGARTDARDTWRRTFRG